MSAYQYEVNVPKWDENVCEKTPSSLSKSFFFVTTRGLFEESKSNWLKSDTVSKVFYAKMPKQDFKIEDSEDEDEDSETEDEDDLIVGLILFESLRSKNRLNGVGNKTKLAAELTFCKSDYYYPRVSNQKSNTAYITSVLKCETIDFEDDIKSTDKYKLHVARQRVQHSIKKLTIEQIQRVEELITKLREADEEKSDKRLLELLKNKGLKIVDSEGQDADLEDIEYEIRKKKK
jgi:hypothetical protein